MDKQEKNKALFVFLLALTVAALAVAVTLIVFCFINAAGLGMFQSLLVGVAVVALVVLSTLTVLRGIAAYRE